MTIERRYADGRLERLPALVAELATLHVDVFVVTTNSVAKAVQQTTPQIPIVMLVAEEPVALDSSRASRILGATSRGWRSCPVPEIYGKNLELLTEVLPPGARIGVLFNPTSSVTALWLHATEEAAQGLQVTLVPAGVRSAEDFDSRGGGDATRERDGLRRPGGCAVHRGQHERINELAVRNGLAVMWPMRRGAVAGGLLSYGTPHLSAGAVRRPMWTRFSRGPTPATCRWSSR